MSEKTVDFIIDLDKPEEDTLNDLQKLIAKKDEKLKKEGQVALNFLIKKKGEKDKTFVYNLNKENINKAEQNLVFPKVVEEVLKKEFNPKIATNEKLRDHIMEELKKDPYWSDRVVKLIKTLKEKG